MIELLITGFPVMKSLCQGKSYTAILQNINLDEEALSGLIADSQSLNILLPQSKVEALSNIKPGEKCRLHLNILTYPDDDSVVPTKSVRAIGKLTKTQFGMLEYLLRGEKIRDIARKECRAFHTINRHMQDIKSTTGLHKCSRINFAYLRFLIEFFRPFSLKNIFSRNMASGRRAG